MAAQVNLAAAGRRAGPGRSAARSRVNCCRCWASARWRAAGSSAEEDAVGAADTAIISESLARRTAGSARRRRRTRRCRLDERPHTIVGVVADASDFGTLQLLSAAAYSRSFADRGEATRVDVWIPLRADPKTLPRETHPIFMLGRLAPGQTTASAQRELGDAGVGPGERLPGEPRPRRESSSRSPTSCSGRVRPTLYVLLGAVGARPADCLRERRRAARRARRGQGAGGRGAARARRHAGARRPSVRRGRDSCCRRPRRIGGVALAFAGVQVLVASRAGKRSPAGQRND